MYIRHDTGINSRAYPSQTNQMPAATVDARFTIQRNSSSKPQYLDFRNGNGFHDQMWSDLPLPRAVKSWHRGHVRMNPVGANGMPDTSSQNHTVVWWQGETHDGRHKWSSVYAVHDGTIVEEGCDRNNKGVLSIATSATGHNDTINIAPGMDLQLDITKVQRLLEIKDLDVGRRTGNVKASLGDVMLAGTAWVEEGKFRSDTTQWGPPGARDGYVIDA
ncbi:hypothetical protein BKA63DRAFT_86196 [Paraphoma chrysanthemicola]|nr:hypothetical protein BKA63DRAFT_86196 [Paraphoma chrysanthemicola]